MVLVLTRCALTPISAKSTGPSRLSSEPMEDPNSSGTRKRPRLDSGDRAYRSMSADRLTATPTHSRLSKAPTTPPNGILSSQSPRKIDDCAPVSHTPSKVTINVREPVENSSPARISPQINGTASLRGGDGGDYLPNSAKDSSNKHDCSSSNVISVTSSPTNSPEIEVAEVEDMNDESGETRWKPLTSATSMLEAKTVQDTLLLSFPFLGERGRSLRKTLAILAQTLEKSDLEDGKILDALANWIETYLETTELHFSQWWEMYLEEQEFWNEFPSLPEAILHRSNANPGSIRMTYLGNGEAPNIHNPLQSFLVAYTALALRLARIDNQTLAGHIEDPGAVPDLISNRYLASLHNLLAYGAPFWKSLVDLSRYDSKLTITAMISRFALSPANGVKCMTEMVEELFERSQKLPVLTQSLWVHINIAVRLIQHYRLLQRTGPIMEEALVIQLQELPSQVYQFFLALDHKLQTFISKQVSALSIETSQGLVLQLSTLLQHIARSDLELTHRIVEEDLCLIQRFDKEEAASIVELAWKFGLLKKCILEGRMEIRVQGVETMQLELVQIFQKHVQGSEGRKDHPVAQFLADFMLNNKLIEYFVGVDSHPQLINRCANIIGFLVVTDRYTEAESDTIWQAVTTSQDSRFIDALLNMLIGIFNISTYPILLYLIAKLNELPIHSFDSSMINYARTLLDHLRKTWKQIPGAHSGFQQKMDMPPFHLCIRLLRQCTAESSMDLNRKREIHLFATTELNYLLPSGPSDTDRRAIYEECITDISNRTEFTTGSVSAINALVAQDPQKQIQLLFKDSDLTSQLIGEFAHMINAERCLNTSPQILDDRLVCRSCLLEQIIARVPNTITADAGAQLWDFAVGSRALHDAARDYMWMCFCKAIRLCNSGDSRNSFIDQCIKTYLPQLQPRFYTNGCLCFVQDVNSYHLVFAASRTEENINEEPTAIDLLWQLSLTSPIGTIEHKAISLLVALYLDSPDVQHRTRAVTEAVHIGIVERCMRQLTCAGSRLRAFSDGTSSGEDEPMVIVASEDEIQAHRLCFSRSLMILKELVHGVRSRPKYSPQAPSQAPLPAISQDIKGNPIRIMYQYFGGGSGTPDIRTLEVGDLETIQDLSCRLVSLTGLSKFKLIAGGQVLDLIKLADQTLRDLKFNQKGLLLVQRELHADSEPKLASASGLRPAELEILGHFSELYQLLGMEEKFAREVYEFLLAFPPHSNITALVRSNLTPLDDVFPSTAPYKILYAVYALKFCLVHHTQDGVATSDLICHGIQMLTTTLSTLQLNIGSHEAEVDISVALGLIECLLTFLKEPVSARAAEISFHDPPTLIRRLQSLIPEALGVANSPEAEYLASCCFATLLKVSLRSETLWNHFKDAAVCSTLLRRLLIEEPRWMIRVRVADYLKGIRHSSSTLQSTPARDFVPYLWKNVTLVVSCCLNYDNGSQQFFEVAMDLLQSMDRSHRETLDIEPYVREWSWLLLGHEHDEFVGRDSLDWIVFGLSSLLNSCFQMSRALGSPLHAREDYVEKLFHAHLFPEIPDLSNDAPVKSRVPNLHTKARKELYSNVLVLSNDISGYQKLLALVSDLLSQGEDSQGWSWGFAQMSEDYNYEPNFSFDRSKCIRSPTGYPGLRNLSNTCYMNSLFTQLFMNISFRGFILGTNVADSAASQKLLHETQRFFAFMQDSMLKSVDSQGIVDSLVTYDNALIDVSIQMDVDEFYNLLFDRWESQILSAADKRTFRAFYGGQIVQQIKSKECPHISEKLEPFSAIQCDIQGKSNLTDSLNAYVGGEVMEGDNKYSCTSCGSYVDAVKRACLKDIPNNLIFHLKRFDYDVMTGMRSKINDCFEFPEQIDMAPYHVDSLKDSELLTSPDWFQLVGVLVHSGTAESGHYYSYIKERPTNPATGRTWVEFNDTDVTPFDPALIPDQCFGGLTDPQPYSSRYLKSWNAYMLFYERIDPKATELESQLALSSSVPAKSEIPAEIAKHVAFDNAHWLRIYCMFDPSHAVFARELLEKLRDVNNGTCTQDHRTEAEAICLSLDHLDRVLSRSKDSSEFGKMLASLTKVIGTCATCCKLALEWVVDHESALRNLLLRCPSAKVRKDFAAMVLEALQHLRKNQPQWYGFDEVDDIDRPQSDTELRPEKLFSRLVSRLKDLWNFLPNHIKAWDDYFGLLADMANFGFHEAHVLLNHGYLIGCLEFLVVENPKASQLRNSYPHYASYCRLLEKGRRFSMDKLIELFANLFAKIDLHEETVRRLKDRRLDHDGMRLTESELNFIQFGGDISRSKNHCVFLEKILGTGINPAATKMIIQAMVLAEPELNMLELVHKTIKNGINVDPASLAAPYLRAAICFCECTPSPATAQHLIAFIAGEVDTIGISGGREHLDFFAQARRIRSLRPGIPPNFFNNCVLRAVPQWAPPLVVYWDEPIRKGTIDLLKTLIFGYDIKAMDDEEHAELIETAGRDLQVACARRCQGIVQQQKTIDSKSVEQVVAVIKHCISAYYDPEDDPRPVTEAENILASLEALTASDVDEAASDGWNNGSDDLPTDSDSEAFNNSP